MAKKELLRLLDKIKRDGSDAFRTYILEESDFLTAPASSKVTYHSCYSGGLMQHTLNVYNRLKEINKRHKFGMSEETLALVSICHDLCKLDLYIPYILKSGKQSESNPYKLSDLVPLGHGVKSLSISQDFFKLSDIEKLMIRWHTWGFEGDYEMYNRSLKPMRKIIIAMHLADMEATFMDE